MKFGSAAAVRSRWISIALYAGAAGLAVLSVLETGLEVIGHDDLWWNLATGRYIAEHFEIPKVDVFTHTFAGMPWVNFEWLSNLLFFEIHDHLGENWIAWLRVGLIFLIFGVTLGFCRRRSGSWLISFAAVAYGAWVCRPFLDARPQLFTFLFSILLLLILDLFRRGGPNLLFWIPPMMVLWTQLHGGYFLGLLLLVGNLAAESGKRLFGLPAEPLAWGRIRTLVLATLASAAAVVFNPWTFEAYVDPVRMSKHVGGTNIFLEVTGEWLRPQFLSADFLTPFQFWPYLLVLGLLTLPIAVAQWKSFDLNDTALAVVLALAFALQHRRFIPLFTVLTLPLLSYGLAFWVDWWLHGRRRPGAWSPGSALPPAPAARRRSGATLAAVACWLILVLLLPSRLAFQKATYAGGQLFRTSVNYQHYPERAVRFLRDAGIRGRMFNLYNWGGFLEWSFPEERTFIDGRAQMVFDEAFHERYLSARWGLRGWEAVMDDYGVTYALLHAGTNAVLLEAMDRDPSWTQVFEHGSSAVFLKDVPENAEPLERFRRRELPLPETAETYLLYGRRAGRAGDAERELEELSRALELAPADHGILARYVLALARADRSGEALARAERALAKAPGSPPLRIALARVEAASGRAERAFAILRELFESTPGSDPVIDAMLEIDPDEARREIERTHDRTPGRPWVSYAMARLAESAGRVERARRYYAVEGRLAEAARDYERMLRCRQALDRTDTRPE